MHSEDHMIMLKTRAALNEISVKSKSSSQKVWPSLAFQRDDNDTDEFNANQSNSISGRILQEERHYVSNNSVSESFHNAMGPILGLAQIFGIFPIYGVRSSSPSKLYFKKLSYLAMYSVFNIIVVLFMTVVSVVHMIKTLNAETFQIRGGIGAATVGVVFYGNSLLGAVLFFWLSSRWISIQYEWRAMEQYIDSNCSETPRLRCKFLVISSIILLLAFVEHILSVVNNARGYELSGTSNSTFRNFIEVYSLRSHSFIFDTLDYSFFFGIYVFVVSKLATFTWNFTDLFIILVSTGLAERYKALNKKLATAVAKYRSTLDWHKLREDFAILSCVVKKVDDHISPIILLSFANNLYFICLQLLNGLSSNESGALSTIYFFGSFAFLIGRTCAVTLFSARINDQSKKALPYLYNCSTSSYSVETQRLQYQLATDDVVLTGLRFFSITRNFMLAVAGAITTYEVVLLQFNGRDD